MRWGRHVERMGKEGKTRTGFWRVDVMEGGSLRDLVVDWLISLTLRLLMSYIYMEHLILMFLDHTQRRSTVGRTPLHE